MTAETNTTLLSWLGAAAIAFALSAAYLLDGPDEVESARLDAQALVDARRTAAATLRRDRAIERYCAEQGATARQTLDDGFACVR